MTDINVWLALTVDGHIHRDAAWKWFHCLKEDQVLFCRFTQLGFLRLLTTAAAMGDNCMTVGDAWRAYDEWLRDPHVGFCQEPAEVDSLFRLATAPVSHASSPKALGDCYLLAVSQAVDAQLVTFDAGLCRLADRLYQDVVLLK